MGVWQGRPQRTLKINRAFVIIEMRETYPFSFVVFLSLCIVVCTENGLLASVYGSRKEKIVLSFFPSPTHKFQSKLTLLARGLPPLRTTKQGQRPHGRDGLA